MNNSSWARSISASSSAQFQNSILDNQTPLSQGGLVKLLSLAQTCADVYALADRFLPIFEPRVVHTALYRLAKLGNSNDDLDWEAQPEASNQQQAQRANTLTALLRGGWTALLTKNESLGPIEYTSMVYVAAVLKCQETDLQDQVLQNVQVVLHGFVVVSNNSEEFWRNLARSERMVWRPNDLSRFCWSWARLAKDRDDCGEDMDISTALSVVEQPIRQILQLGLVSPVDTFTTFAQGSANNHRNSPKPNAMSFASSGNSSTSCRTMALREVSEERLYFKPTSLALMAWAYDISSFGRGMVELLGRQVIDRNLARSLKPGELNMLLASFENIVLSSYHSAARADSGISKQNLHAPKQHQHQHPHEQHQLQQPPTLISQGDVKKMCEEFVAAGGLKRCGPSELSCMASSLINLHCANKHLFSAFEQALSQDVLTKS